jgi:hypothetical protein
MSCTYSYQCWCLSIHYRATKQFPFFPKTMSWVSPKHQVVTMGHRWRGISAYNKNNFNIRVQPDRVFTQSKKACVCPCTSKLLRHQAG